MEDVRAARYIPARANCRLQMRPMFVCDRCSHTEDRTGFAQGFRDLSDETPYCRPLVEEPTAAPSVRL